MLVSRSSTTSGCSIAMTTTSLPLRSASDIAATGRREPRELAKKREAVAYMGRVASRTPKAFPTLTPAHLEVTRTARPT
jgi:hypothetical protein